MYAVAGIHLGPQLVDEPALMAVAGHSCEIAPETLGDHARIDQLPEDRQRLQPLIIASALRWLDQRRSAISRWTAAKFGASSSAWPYSRRAASVSFASVYASARET